jgi:16S rRNA (cytosine1402-N4)-methyltransferase
MINFSIKKAEEPVELADSHIPVMYREVVELLNISPGAVMVDGTVGLAGHARMIAEKIGPQGKLIGIDRDNQSLAVAKENLSSYGSQCEFVRDDFRHIDRILSERGVTAVDGILLDLGISSFQLNNPERGFSFKNDGPLDMRMDQESYISAYDLINSLSEQEISSLLKNFGEERYHHRIARHLVEQRAKTPFQTTQELSEAIVRSIPGHSRHQKIHPATRTFQALRIAVNHELDELTDLLDMLPEILAPRGRAVFISFHSLEDRLIKRTFRRGAIATDHSLPIWRLLQKRPLIASDDKISTNPRSRSAKLRAIEKYDPSLEIT